MTLNTKEKAKDEVENIFLNQIEILDDAEKVQDEKYTILKYCSSILYNIFSGIIIGIAVLFVIAFLKLRTENIDIHFAKNLILKNLNNISFGNLALGWDFSDNRLMLILDNVLLDKNFVLPQLRLYPNTLEILHSNFSIDKLTIVNPKLEVNFDDDKIYINQDLVNEFGKKRKDLQVCISFDDIFKNVKNLIGKKINVKDGRLIIKNKNFVIAEISDIQINNDLLKTFVSLSIGNKKDASKLFATIRNSDFINLDINFENVVYKYLNKLINIPSFIKDAKISGNLSLDLKELYNINKGRFKITGNSVKLDLSNKVYDIPVVNLKGHFNDKTIFFQNLEIKTGATNSVVKNINFNKNRSLLLFDDKSLIKVKNFSIKNLSESKNFPFIINSVKILDGRLKARGVLDPMNIRKDAISFYEYEASFSDADIKIDNLHTFSNIAGNIKHNSGISNIILKSGKIDGLEIKSSAKIDIDDSSCKLSFCTEFDINYLLNSDYFEKFPIFNFFEDANGIFSGVISLNFNKENDTEKLEKLSGIFSCKNRFLKNFNLSIKDAKIEYDNGVLSVNGKLKDNISFVFNSDKNYHGNFKINGELSTRILSMLSITHTMIDGVLDTVISATFNNDYININIKSDSTKSVIKLPIIGVIKSKNDKGIIMLNSIIRGNNVKTNFNLSTAEKSFLGKYISDNGNIMFFESKLEDLNNHSMLSISAEDYSKNWKVNLSLKNFKKNIDWISEINKYKSNILLNFNIENSVIFNEIPFAKAFGSVNIYNGNIEEANVNGLFNEGKTFKIKCFKDGDILSFSILSNNAGNVLKILNISDEILNGNIKLQMISSLDKTQFNGSIDISNFMIKNSNYIHNIILLTSPFGNTFGDNISFNSLSVKFKNNGRFINIRDGQAIGPSIWMTFGGVYNSISKNFKVTGYTIPMHAYISQRQLMLSNYLITGSLEHPIVEVSPLTEITKNDLLKLFNTARQKFIFGQ